MHLEVVILSEVSQRKTNIIYHLYVESKIWHNWNYLQNKNKSTDTEHKLMIAKGERWEEQIRSLGQTDTYHYIHKIGNQQWPAL